MRPALKTVVLAGVALASTWGPSRIGLVVAQEEVKPARSARGGLLAKSDHHQFEVFFYPTGARVFPQDHAGTAVDASQLAGTATFYHPNSPEPWFTRTLRGTTESLDLAIGLSHAPQSGAKVAFEITGLSGTADKAAFTVPLEFAPQPAAQPTAPAVVARSPRFVYGPGYYGFGYYQYPGPETAPAQRSAPTVYGYSAERPWPKRRFRLDPRFVHRPRLSGWRAHLEAVAEADGLSCFRVRRRSTQADRANIRFGARRQTTMIHNAVWCLAAVTGLACAPGAVLAQDAGWQADHDAGWAAYKEGRFAEAEKRLRAAETEARAFGAEDPRLATTLDHLAWVVCAEGKPAEGEPLAKSALAIREKTLGPEHPDVVKSLNTLACLYDMDGKPKEAKPIYERCLALAEKAHGKEHPGVAAVLDNLATVDHALGDNDEAEAAYKRASRSARRPRTGSRSTWPRPSTTSGFSMSRRGKYAEAEPLLKRALAIREKALGTDHPDVATSLEALGLLYTKQGKTAAAEPLLKRSLAIYESGLGANHPHVARCCAKMAQCCRAMGQEAEAEKLETRVKAIQEKHAHPQAPK